MDNYDGENVRNGVKSGPEFFVFLLERVGMKLSVSSMVVTVALVVSGSAFAQAQSAPVGASAATGAAAGGVAASTVAVVAGVVAIGVVASSNSTTATTATTATN